MTLQDRGTRTEATTGSYFPSVLLASDRVDVKARKQGTDTRHAAQPRRRRVQAESHGNARNCTQRRNVVGRGDDSSRSVIQVKIVKLQLPIKHTNADFGDFLSAATHAFSHTLRLLTLRPPLRLLRLRRAPRQKKYREQQVARE